MFKIADATHYIYKINDNHQTIAKVQNESD